MDRVVHFEIPADDLDRAGKFYSKIFGWKQDEFPMPGGKILMVSTVKTDKRGIPTESGGINGDISKRKTKKDHTIIVINVSSIDKYLPKVKAAGGKLIQPKVKIADMGFYARVTDPEGNALGLWEDVK